jgi:hypothetical protein
MIRKVNHNGRDYLVVDTALKVEKGTTSIMAPLHVRVDINRLSEEDRQIIQRRVHRLFNHIITLKEAVPPPPKPWWKKIFNKAKS